MSSVLTQDTRLKNSDLPCWYLKAYAILVVAVFFLIALGGSVRIMKAGLACPDWPLCFGEVIPDYHPQVYFEFIHRVVAGLVAIATLVMQVILFRSRLPARLKVLGLISLVILMGQVAFGALTVTLLLKAGVVATHLILGTSFFITLLWILMSLKEVSSPSVSVPGRLKGYFVFLAAAIYVQILLGGLVASNFAALACFDFPTCRGQWFPEMTGEVGLHMLHRFSAYAVFLLITLNIFLVQKFSASSTRLRNLAKLMMLAVIAQVVLGIANVLLLTPPLVAVAHLALGVFILSLTFRQIHAVRGSHVSVGLAIG